MSPDESVGPPFSLELGHSSFLSLRLLGCELIHTVKQHSQVHTAPARARAHEHPNMPEKRKKHTLVAGGTRIEESLPNLPNSTRRAILHHRPQKDIRRLPESVRRRLFTFH